MADPGLEVVLRQDGPIRLDVAFRRARGEVLAIFGPSGSGKTTSLRSIAGLYTPKGRCHVVGDRSHALGQEAADGFCQGTIGDGNLPLLRAATDQLMPVDGRRSRYR